jgi:hypothetical protein
VQLDEAKARIGQLEAELAASRAKIGRLEAEVLALRAQVEVLLEQLARNSKNSNLPPSSDPPGKPKDQDEDKDCRWSPRNAEFRATTTTGPIRPRSPAVDKSSPPGSEPKRMGLGRRSEREPAQAQTSWQR